MEETGAPMGSSNVTVEGNLASFNNQNVNERETLTFDINSITPIDNEKGGVDKGVGEPFNSEVQREIPIESENANQNNAVNRWEKEEVLTLIKIRSEIDATFKAASTKSHLWDEISRKMAELGYQRSTHKCKEKFININKYHKRTKEGRTRQPRGQAYRFSNQLEALNTNPNTRPTNAPPMAMLMTREGGNPHLENSSSMPSSFGKKSKDSTEKKRKFKESFDRVVKEFFKRQEIMQERFMKSLQQFEKDCEARDEEWREELQSIREERKLLAQQISLAMTKKSIMMELLEKYQEEFKTLQGKRN